MARSSRTAARAAGSPLPCGPSSSGSRVNSPSSRSRAAPRIRRESFSSMGGSEFVMPPGADRPSQPPARALFPGAARASGSGEGTARGEEVVRVEVSAVDRQRLPRETLRLEPLRVKLRSEDAEGAALRDPQDSHRDRLLHSVPERLPPRLDADFLHEKGAARGEGA